MEMDSRVFPMVIRARIMAADSKYSWLWYSGIRAMLSVPPVTMRVIFSRMNRDQRKDTPEPRATKVSMLGAPCRRDLKPERKKSRLMVMMIRASSICKIPSPMWLWFKKSGTGQFSMLWPMVMYISTKSTPMESFNRRRSFGVSRSRRASSSARKRSVIPERPCPADSFFSSAS